MANPLKTPDRGRRKGQQGLWPDRLAPSAAPTLQFLLAVLVLCATAFVMRTWEDTGPWSEAMAAWVQAFGVVGAIGSGVWLAKKQSQDETEQERRQVVRKDEEARYAALALARIGIGSISRAIQVLELPRSLGEVDVELTRRDAENAKRAITGFRIASLRTDQLIAQFYPFAGLMADVDDNLRHLLDTLSDGPPVSPSQHTRVVALTNLKSIRAMAELWNERLRIVVEAADR